MCSPTRYVLDAEEGAFNLFDFCIVVVSLAFALSGSGGANGSSVAVGRLLRLIRVVLKVPQLRYVLLGFVAFHHIPFHSIPFHSIPFHSI